MSDVVHIPGYRIEQQLGRGGMAKVYLAVQESVQRRVALKVMSQVLLVDDAFSDRFIREARIAANLTHPHIVAVHDVGVHENHHYIAMEYLPGGDLAARCRNEENGCALSEALTVTQEIASALEYAHRKGFVHRDVKPENILFRDNGTAVLTDFGIARAVNSTTQMTKTGAVIGTPQYMSPEQARGQEVDGRSDLYSLGVVFYEMLTGKVPFEAADSVAVGIKHITEPVPRLPRRLASLQPAMDRFMAKEPAQRWASGGEAAIELQRLTERSGKASPSSTLSDTAAASTRVVAPVTADQLGAATTDEPRLGQLDELAINSHRRHTRRARKRRSIWPSLLFLLLAGGAGAAWYWRDQLPLEQWLAMFNIGQAPEVIEDTAAPESVTAVDTPVTVDDDGPGEMAQIDLQAQTGDDDLGSDQLAEIERLSLQRQAIEAAIDDGNLTEAEALLNGLVDDQSQATADLRERFAAAVKTEQAAAEQRAQAAEAERQRAAEQAQREQQIADWLNAAETARREDRLIAPADPNAIDLYRQVLTLDPGNGDAARGLREVTQVYIDRAEVALEADELEQVSELIASIQSISPDAAALTQIRRRLTLYRQQRERNRISVDDQARIGPMLNTVDQAIASGQLMEPPGASAFDQLKAIQRIDPNNAEVQSRLKQLGLLLAGDAEQLLNTQQLDSALGRLRQIRQVDPTSDRLAELGSRAAEQAAGAAAAAIEAGELDRAAQLLDAAERLNPDLEQLESLYLQLNLAREQPAASG